MGANVMIMAINMLVLVLIQPRDAGLAKSG